MSVPTVAITKVLKDALSDDGYDMADYLAQFRDWKTDWNRKEYLFWFFGKDGANKFPLRNKVKVLRHVHLPPEAEAKSKQIWNMKLYVVSEPDGHNVQGMNTPEDTLMNILADQSAEYLDTGNIYL